MSAVDDLIAAGRALVDAGLSPGASGNISVRDGDRLLMSGTGTRLGALTPDDIAVLSVDGNAVDGARPSKEVPLHVAMYARNPQHRAVVHVHSPSTVAVSCLKPWAEHTAVPPLTPYSLMRVGQVPLLDFLPPGDPAMGDLITACPFPFHGALLANHGAVVSGPDPASAVDSTIELEEACRITLLTDGRQRRLIPPARVAEITARWGTPWTATASVS